MPSKIIVNKIYTKQAGVAEQFDNYFINVGPTLANKIAMTNRNISTTHFINKSPITSFSLSPIIEKQVFNLLSSLNESKSCINIPIKLIKMARCYLTSPLTKIYNESITTGKVPEIFKISRVTPRRSPKSGDPTELGNYRAIAVISPFNKIFERLISI